MQTDPVEIARPHNDEATPPATDWLDRLKARAPAWFCRWMCWDMTPAELQELKEDMRIW